MAGRMREGNNDGGRGGEGEGVGEGEGRGEGVGEGRGRESGRGNGSGRGLSENMNKRWEEEEMRTKRRDESWKKDIGRGRIEGGKVRKERSICWHDHSNLGCANSLNIFFNIVIKLVVQKVEHYSQILGKNFADLSSWSY